MNSSRYPKGHHAQHREVFKQHECVDILKRYQPETPFLRLLVDEISEPADPPFIVLRHMDSDVLSESNKKRLSRPEIKQVAQSVLEALHVKLDSILVNYGSILRHVFPLIRQALSLLFGGDYHLFNPKVEGIGLEDDVQELTVLKRMHKFFGPYPGFYRKFNDPGTMTIIYFINSQEPPAKPFARAGPRISLWSTRSLS
ncbi:hypothetical protein N0V88_006425 [Collariella sp. IMI 366227]|nr:hypothetical protein N0V88_006425 [Collariella sp. IMI 366227]